VLGIGALAPLFAIICATRFVRMVSVQPKAVAAN
jgi:hypothetical protein